MVNIDTIIQQCASNPLATKELKRVGAKILQYLQSNQEYPNVREKEWFMKYITDHNIFTGVDTFLEDIEVLLKILA